MKSLRLLVAWIRRLEFMSVVTFVRTAISDYKSTASLVPSSRYLARVMVRPLCGKAPRVVVEFGPGTGVMTRELLRLMPDDGTLLAFEVSTRFVTYLRETVPDPRLQIVQASATTAAMELSRRGIEQVDGIVSSLGISFMDVESVDGLFRPLLPHLGKKGTITQFQYVTAAWGSMAGVFSISMRAVMKRYFCCVQSTSVWLNLPPAFVITGHGERTAAEAVVSENANGAGSGYQQMSD